MELEEARKQATECRELKKKYGGEDAILGPGWCALSVLDDRITELEAQRDELVEAAFIAGLNTDEDEWIYPFSADFKIKLTADYMTALRASDKEDKGENI